MKATIEREVKKAIQSLTGIGWKPERIAERLSSRESYGLQGLPYSWALDKAKAIQKGGK